MVVVHYPSLNHTNSSCYYSCCCWCLQCHYIITTLYFIKIYPFSYFIPLFFHSLFLCEFGNVLWYIAIGKDGFFSWCTCTSQLCTCTEDGNNFSCMKKKNIQRWLMVVEVCGSKCMHLLPINYLCCWALG